jgi:hypothetical protein
MDNINAKTLIDTAIRRKELDLLLLGAEGYVYRSRYSVSPSETDVVQLLESLYDYVLKCEDHDAIATRLGEAAIKIAATYEGLFAAVYVVSCEEYYRGRNLSTLELPVEKIVIVIRETIRRYTNRLRHDWSVQGYLHTRGRYGCIKRLASVIKENGGPDIMP